MNKTNDVENKHVHSEDSIFKIAVQKLFYDIVRLMVAYKHLRFRRQ